GAAARSPDPHPRARPDLEGTARGPKRAEGSVQTLPLLWPETVHPLDDPRRVRIGGARLALLLLGEVGGSPHEELVDLRRVRKVGRALRRDGRVVVEDEGRREQKVAGPRLAGEAREEPVVFTFSRRLRGPCGRVE